MKHRLISAMALVLILSAAIVLDWLFASAWFSATLIAVVLLAGTGECVRLLRLREQRRNPGRTLGWRRRARHVLGASVGIGLPGAFLFALRLRENGLWLVLYLVAVAKMVDNGALFAGRMWGRRRLAPQTSPAKTVEGLYGGLAAGIVTAVVLAPFCTGGRMGSAVVFGLTVSLFAVLGDLAESRLKRAAGVKDSGLLMPGIGGVLDLMDSILLSAPIAYGLLVVCNGL